MNIIKILSPAKINFDLKIGKLQNNNNEFLHEIETRMHTIPLYDEIEIKKIKAGNHKRKIKISVSGKYKNGVPSNGDNIVFKSTKLFFEKIKIPKSTEDIQINLIKNIPNQAGLGGASSNAGAILKGLQELFQKKIEPEKLQKISLQLGSDVPFFTLGVPHAKITGIGEYIEKLKPENFFCLVAMLPNIFISTKWAFQKWDQYQNLYLQKKITKEFQNNNSEPNYFETQDVFLFAKRNNLGINSKNDFEKIIFTYFPDLKNLKNEILKYGAKYSGLSGSGSTIFGTFDNQNEMEICYQKIKNKCDFLWMNNRLVPS